jgi:hypothetical protein
MSATRSPFPNTSLVRPLSGQRNNTIGHDFLVSPLQPVGHRGRAAGTSLGQEFRAECEPLISLREGDVRFWRAVAVSAWRILQSLGS